MATLRMMQQQEDLQNLNKKTKFEELNITNCTECNKLLCRGTDTDIRCDICWDKLMPPDEPNYNLYKKLNDKYTTLVKNTSGLDEKNKLILDYNLKVEEIDEK